MYFEKLFQILSSMYVCAVTPSVSFSLVLLQDSGVLSDMRQSMLIRIRWVVLVTLDHRDHKAFPWL